MEEQSTTNLQKEEIAPYKQCLNCGENLQGVYCHKCGQRATNPTPKVWEFILEYMNNAFIWDSKCLPTMWHLIRRPGYLTNEFNAGKFVAYEHPLKLNMFFLFVFVTIFLLFSNVQKADESFDNVTKNEIFRPFLSLGALNDDAVYSAKMKESERDTITLSMPSLLAEKYPEIISTIQANTNHGKERLDTLVVAIPQVLIKDKILVANESSIYAFSSDNDIVDNLLQLDIISEVWRKLLDILTQYFPLIFLITSPLLALAVKLLYLKQKKPFISFFIFALHYTAFVEFILLIVYLLYLAVQPSFEALEWIIIIASCLYLSVAVKTVYESNSWIKSVVKALLISLIYQLICIAAFFVIFIVATFIVML